MPCIVCEKPDSETKYKCPQCGAKYCSVACYKVHKTQCIHQVSDTSKEDGGSLDNKLTETSTGANPKNEEFEALLKNERIAELLKSQNVRLHLTNVYNILHDAKLSGEYTPEGRRLVALKKIRELRKGGREANAAIEELANIVMQTLKVGDD